MRAYEEFVAIGGYSFWSSDGATRLGDAIKFCWEMM